MAESLGEKFIIRATHDRLDAQGGHILKELRESEIKGKIKMTIPENHKKKAKEREATMALRYQKFEVKKPQIRNADASCAPSLTLNLISIKEEGGEGIEWILMTNLLVETNEDALQVVEYYRQRWKIERFHFVLKSGCEIEKIQQRSVDAIELLLLMYSIIAAHIMQLTFIARTFPETPCSLLFSESEWQTLYRAAQKTRTAPETPYSMADAVRYVAKLGGFVGAKSDGPPGLKVIWLGLNALYLLNAYREFI